MTQLGRIATAGAVAALMLGTTAAVAHSDGDSSGHSGSGGYWPSHHRPDVAVSSTSRDLRPDVTDPTDGVRSRLALSLGRNSTKVRWWLWGFDPAAVGTRFGAHVHVGPCVAGDGTAAGPHYNDDVLTGAEPVRVSPETEVWLDFEVRPHGRARVKAMAPFRLEPGDRSVVIHELPTASDGTAGARLACVPLVW